MWLYYSSLIRVNRVPVLSKAIILAVLIFSKTPLFLIKIPFFIAMFRIMEITLGTARPRAQGQEATRTPMPLSTIQHTLQVDGIFTNSKLRSKNQIIITEILRKTTVLTKYLETVLQTAWIPDSLWASSFCFSFIWVPISIKMLF